jgi:hypothetical protein
MKVSWQHPSTLGKVEDRVERVHTNAEGKKVCMLMSADKSKTDTKKNGFPKKSTAKQGGKNGKSVDTKKSNGPTPIMTLSPAGPTNDALTPSRTRYESAADSAESLEAKESLREDLPKFEATPNGGRQTRFVSTISSLVGDVNDDNKEMGPRIRRKLVLTLVCFLPALFAVVLFSDVSFGDDDATSFRLGYGADLHKTLKEKSAFSNMLLGGSFLLFITLYLFDFSYWVGRWATISQVSVKSGFLLFFLGTLLRADKYPQAPLALYVLSVPFYMDSIISKHLYPSLSKAKFFATLAPCLFLTGVSLVLLWLIWLTSEKQYWSRSLRLDLSVRLGCITATDLDDLTKYEMTKCNLGSLGNSTTADRLGEVCDNLDLCVEARLLWFGPLLTAGGAIIFGIVSKFLGRSLRKSHSKLTNVRVLCGTVVLLGFGLWIAASVASAGNALANVVFAFVFIGMVILVMMVLRAIGWQSLRQRIGSVPLMRKLGEIGRSDWIRALAVITCWLPFVMYLGLSCANQFIRRRVTRGCWKNCCSINFLLSKEHEHDTGHDGSIQGSDAKGGDGEDDSRKTSTGSADGDTRKGSGHSRRKFQDIGWDHKGWFTKVTSEQLSHMGLWAWSSVLVKAIWWGIAFWLLNAGITKVVTVFLSWLNQFLESQELVVVITIFYMIGLFMYVTHNPLHQIKPNLCTHSRTVASLHLAPQVFIAARARCTRVYFRRCDSSEQDLDLRWKDRDFILGGPRRNLIHMLPHQNECHLRAAEVLR